MLRAGRAGFTKKSLHLTFQSVQRGKTDGDAAPPSSTNRLEESDPVQQDSQRPRAAEGSDPEDETIEKLR